MKKLIKVLLASSVLSVSMSVSAFFPHPALVIGPGSTLMLAPPLVDSDNSGPDDIPLGCFLGTGGLMMCY